MFIPCCIQIHILNTLNYICTAKQECFLFLLYLKQNKDMMKCINNPYQGFIHNDLYFQNSFQ